MRTIFAKYNPQCNSIDVYASASYMLRIDCLEAEKNLKTTPGSECALTSLAIHQRQFPYRKCQIKKSLEFKNQQKGRGKV